VSTPAENQQTVGALAAIVEQGMSSYVLAPDGAVCLNTNYNPARAALRDLVAKADTNEELVVAAKEAVRVMRFQTYGRYAAVTNPARLALEHALARLDGIGN